MLILGILVGLLIIFSMFMLFMSFTNIGESQMGIVERKYFGKEMPPGRIVAQDGEIGIQARTLLPGLHFIIPFVMKVYKKNLFIINENQVGFVEAYDGNPIRPGKIFADVSQGHNLFQDGESFLKNGGQKGPQTQILPPGPWRINPKLFKVSIMNNIEIKRSQVGVITAIDGEPLTQGRLLGKKIEGHNNFENGEIFFTSHGEKGPQIDILLPGTYRINTELFKVEIGNAIVIPSGKIGLVTAKDGNQLPDKEFVARSISDHSDFQNGSKFIENGGERGPQLDVLKPGTYYINPLLFDVEIDNIAEVERGQVAVIISNVGKEVDEIKNLVEKSSSGNENLDDEVLKVENRLDTGIERYVVPKGCRGIQNEVAGPGIYYLNRRAFIAHLVDTTNITVDWDDKEDTKFDPLKVISKDGFDISVSVKVIIRVRPDQAPYMVAKIGSIDNLINHVIHPMIDSSFRNQASSTSAMNFMQDRQEEQTKAENRARSELEKYHVECVSVLICQITLPQNLMDTQTSRIIAQQELLMFNEQEKSQQARIMKEKTMAEAEMQVQLVTAEMGVKVSEQDKLKAIRTAEGNAESIRLSGEAEGSRILAIGKATAESYRLQKEAIGGEGIVTIEAIKSIAEGNIKVTPDFLIQGSDSIGGLLSTFLTQKVTGFQGLSNIKSEKNIITTKENNSETKEKEITETV